MSFATRVDLLARSNARRLSQLAVPADVAMPPDDALRAAISGSVLTGYTAAEQSAIALALGAIDTALGDADQLILSYGIPATVQTTLLARMASVVALYYLQGAERMTDDVRKAFEGVEDTLKGHASGKLNLIPPEQRGGTPANDFVQFWSESRRYGASR